MNDYEDETQAIERDMDIAEMKAKVWVLIAVFAFVLVALLWYGGAHAQTIDRPTRITPYDFQCQDANGNKISDHQQQGIAIVECYNNAQGAIVQGGRYRINRSAAPPVEPAVCPQKPADDTRTAQCPPGTTGSWVQTQSYGSVAYPTCWVPSGFIPSTAPEGACTAIPPPTLPAPGGISATTAPHPTVAGRFNVALSWLAVSGATGYAIERCTGATCTDNFIALGTTTNTAYTNPNLPGGITYRYRIRGTAGSVLGEWSALRNVTTPTAPPPPAGTGTASLSWTPPTENENGTTLADLIGYRVLYGTSATALTQQVVIANASLSQYVVEGLAPGTWYFGLRTIAGDPRCLPAGADCIVFESANSNLATKVVQ